MIWLDMLHGPLAPIDTTLPDGLFDKLSSILGVLKTNQLPEYIGQDFGRYKRELEDGPTERRGRGRPPEIARDMMIYRFSRLLHNVGVESRDKDLANAIFEIMRAANAKYLPSLESLTTEISRIRCEFKLRHKRRRITSLN